MQSVGYDSNSEVALARDVLKQVANKSDVEGECVEVR